MLHRMESIIHNLPSYSVSSCESLQLPCFSCKVSVRRRYRNARSFLNSRQVHREFKMSRLSMDTPLSFDTIVHLQSMLELGRRTRSKEWMSISPVLLTQRPRRYKKAQFFLVTRSIHRETTISWLSLGTIFLLETTRHFTVTCDLPLHIGRYHALRLNPRGSGYGGANVGDSLLAILAKEVSRLYQSIHSPFQPLSSLYQAIVGLSLHAWRPLVCTTLTSKPSCIIADQLSHQGGH